MGWGALSEQQIIDLINAKLNPLSTTEVLLPDSDASNHVGLKAPSVVSVDKVFTMPGGDGPAGSALYTNGAAVLGFTPHPAVVLIYRDIVGGSLVSPNTTEQVSLSYTLPANNYSLIIVVATVMSRALTLGGSTGVNYRIYIGSSFKNIPGMRVNTQNSENVEVESTADVTFSAVQQSSADIKIVFPAGVLNTDIDMQVVALHVYGVL